MTTYRALCVALLLALFSVPAGAAPFNSLSMDVGVCDPNAPLNCIKPDSSGNVPVTGTFSATLGGWAPGGTFATLTATGSSASVALPAGVVVAFQNTGTTTVSCTLGVGSATAIANQIQVPASSTVFITVGSNTFGACIDQTGSASNLVVLAGGAGLGTGFGGGGSGGGGGAVTVADGADVTQGAIADAAVAAGATGSLSAKLRSISRDVMTVNTWAGGTLAVMAAYGTPPTGLVPGVNAFVTNTLTPGQAAMVGSSPVVIASNQTANALWGHGATGSAVPANAQYGGALDAVGGTNLVGIAADPCQTSVKTTLPITLATAAVKVIATGVSAKKIYVCQINLNNNAADTVAIFEATTATTCATSPVAVVGAGTSVATAGTGYNFAATGGISLGNGANQVLVTTVNNNDLCIAQSAATQLTGSITYVTR